jgi:hypothetical protein
MTLGKMGSRGMKFGSGDILLTMLFFSTVFIYLLYLSLCSGEIINRYENKESKLMTKDR